MTERKRVLTTGITGQNGFCLSELLLENSYEVHGIIRRTSTFNTNRIHHVYTDPHNKDARNFVHYGDLTDGTMMRSIFKQVQPQKVYNLSQSDVRVNFDSFEYAADAVSTAMWLILQQDILGDYVFAVEDTYSVQEFLKIAFGCVNVNWNNYIEFNARCLQLIEVYLLIGNVTEVKQQLSYQPLVKFEQLVELMDKADLQARLFEHSVRQMLSYNVLDNAIIKKTE